MKRNLLLLLTTLILLSACAGKPSDPNDTIPILNSDQLEAQQALVDFFQLLHDGKYQEASELYSGSYEWLISSNPDLAPTDLAGLLERGCTQNGLMCLEALSAENLLTASSSKTIFQVEFKLEDGSLFVLGPCCGADETEMPPVSQFPYRVVEREDGSWGVDELPPFVP